MIIHEFVCADCEVDVFSYDGPADQTLCQSCLKVREIKARDTLTPEQEQALREILGCVIPVRKGPSLARSRSSLRTMSYEQARAPFLNLVFG